MVILSICLPVPLASTKREQTRLLGFPTRWHMALVSSEVRYSGSLGMSGELIAATSDPGISELVPCPPFCEWIAGLKKLKAEQVQ